MTDTTFSSVDELVEGQYIPRSYQFERDLEPKESEQRFDRLLFDNNSNSVYVTQDIDYLLSVNGLTELGSMISDFLTNQVARLQILEDYSNAKNYTILHGKKRLDNNKADYRIRHDLAGQVSRFFTGQTVGQPVSIGYADKDEDLSSIDEFNNYNDAESLNIELVYDCSRYGRAYELHYYDENKRSSVAVIDPKEIFVIRSADVRKDILACVHCPTYGNTTYITVYTDNKVIKFKPCKNTAISLEIEQELSNPFLKVPVVEWQNNRERVGDWEKAISLIDAYDTAQSDTANYMSDLNDAMLVIKGDLNSTGLTAKDLWQMKDANMLLLESGISSSGNQTNLDAGYIHKEYDVAGVEGYKTRIIKDFYRVVGLPNLQDDDTFNASSGIAIRYKLIDLEQILSIKKGFFVKALRRRYELLAKLTDNLKNGKVIDSDKLTFTFHENLPTDVWAEIKSAIDVGTEISQETLLETASFTDARNEKKRLAEENARSLTDSERDFVMRSLDNDTSE